MIKKYLFILSVFCIQFLYSQNQQPITITFDNVSLEQVIEKLEEVTEYDFYFQKNWIEDQTISLSFNQATIQEVLNAVFKQSSLNYFITQNRIILTNNSYIYTSLPESFFDNENQLNTEDKSAVFYNEYESKNIKGGVITIGKQDANSNQEFYTISGIVRNESTNEPIQNLVVSTNNKANYTTTNNNGYFVLEVPPGINVIETNLLGYEPTTKNVLVYGNGTLDFEVLEGAEQLDEVLIEAKKDDNVKTAIVGVTTIDVAGIKNIPVVLGERDILKIATTMPGVKTAGEGSSGFNVRGGRTDQNLILLDNAVIYSPSHFLGFFSALNPFTTGSLDIYKASIPSEYGGRLSSVFDIRTKDGNPTDFSGEGSIGPVTANLSVETPVFKEKSSIIAGFRATYSDWVLRSIDDENLKNSEASFYDGILKYKHKLDDKNTFQTSIYYSNDKFSITSDSVYKYNNRLASLKWDHIFNEKNKAEVILVNSQYKYNIDYEADANRNFDFGYKINETQLKLNFDYFYSKKHKFKYGISSKLYNINPGTIKPTDENSDIEYKSLEKEKGLESAIYIADLFEVTDKLLLDFGLRYSFYASMGPTTVNIYEEGKPKNPSTIIDQETYGNNAFAKTYGGPELRLSLRYFLAPELSLKAAYNKTIQYIHLLSNNTTEAPIDTWKLSDFNTKPQNADQFSMGIYKNFDAGNIEISLEGYYKRMNDILDYKVGADLILNENLEQELLQGEGKAYGVEFLLKKKVGKLNGWLGYSYSRSFVKLDSQIDEETVNNGDFFPANYDKPHDFTTVLNYKLTHRFSFSANFTYQTGRPITYPIGKYVIANEEQVVYSDRNQYRIPDYYRLDLGFNIEGNHKVKKLAHSFWNISVFNVLGRNNPYSVFFVNEDGKIQAYQTSIFAIPIPTITYNFKF